MESYDPLLQGLINNEKRLEAIEAALAKSNKELEANEDEVRKVFNSFDADNSGSIDAEELRSVLEGLGQEPSEEELLLLIEEADEDGSGEIEFEEFIPLVKSLSSWIERMKAKKAHLAMLKNFPESHVAVEFNAQREIERRKQRIAVLTRDLVKYRGWHKVIKAAMTAEAAGNLLVKDVISKGEDPFAKRLIVPHPKRMGETFEIPNPWQKKRFDFSCVIS
eukprot:g4332.t1